MNNIDVAISAITAFVIYAGGALTTVFISNGTDGLNSKAYITAAIIGIVAAAKDVRSCKKMPSIDGSGQGIGIAKAMFCLAFMLLLIGCASFSTNVFRAEQTAVNIGYAAYTGYTNGLATGAIKISPDGSNAVRSARLRFAASVGTLETLRERYEVDSALKEPVLAALDTVRSESSNLVWVINYWRKQ